jgi:hypothetical protein
VNLQKNSATSAGVQRYALYAVAALCLTLTAYSGLCVAILVSDARSQSLAEAEQAIAQAAAEHIEQDRVPNALIVSVEALIGEHELGLNYVTLRNADNVTLLSRGRFAQRFAWLGTQTARQWRGWDYQFESAEANRRLMHDGQRIGSAGFGVSWAGIIARAGVPLVIWITALLAGVLGFLGAIAAAAAAGATARSADQKTPGTTIRAAAAQPMSGGERARAPLSRLLRRRERRESGDEFAPIADAQRDGADGDAMPERSATPRLETVPRPAPSARGEAPPPKQPAKPAPSAPASPAQAAPAPPPKPTPPPEPPKPAARSPEPTSQPAAQPSETPQPARSPETPTQKPVARAVAPQGAETTPPAPPRVVIEPAPAYAELHAPRVDAQPRLGDDTLDLRFYPIWRDCERESLAGACAALAWRTGESRLVDADTLTRLAERDGALRAFTQWIARRFSLLHSNWRTLEIATVPIMLPIPSAMLGFADAEAVWRDALRRTDRDANDLILRLSGRVRRNAHNSLPVRRALTLDGPAKPTPPDCDVACINAEQIGPDQEAWYARIEQLRCPVLLGPIAEPEKYARLINHARVLWYSDADEAIHSPRAFARLLARHTTQPI